MKLKLALPIRLFGGDIVIVDVLERRGNEVVVIKLSHPHNEETVQGMLAAGHPEPQASLTLAVPLGGQAETFAICAHLSTALGVDVSEVSTDA